MKGSWDCAGRKRSWCASHQQPLHGTRRSILWAGWSHCPGHASGCLSTPFYPPYLVRRGPFFGQTGCIAQYTLLAASDRAAAGLEHSTWGEGKGRRDQAQYLEELGREGFKHCTPGRGRGRRNGVHSYWAGKWAHSGFSPPPPGKPCPPPPQSHTRVALQVQELALEAVDSAGVAEGAATQACTLGQRGGVRGQGSGGVGREGGAGFAKCAASQPCIGVRGGSMVGRRFNGVSVGWAHSRPA